MWSSTNAWISPFFLAARSISAGSPPISAIACARVRPDASTICRSSAYKAHAAIERFPNLLYCVSVDYELIEVLANELPKSLTDDERVVWELISKYQGTLTRDAEDGFVFEIVRKYWDRLKPIIRENPFHIISARKSVRILQTKPERTPGIGMRGCSSKVQCGKIVDRIYSIS